MLPKGITEGEKMKRSKGQRGGARPGAGRKPLLEEASVREILRLSDEILQRWLSNPEVPDEKKIPVVKDLIGKRIPTTQEIEYNEEQNFTLFLQECIKRTKECPDDPRKTLEVKSVSIEDKTASIEDKTLENKPVETEPGKKESPEPEKIPDGNNKPPDGNNKPGEREINIKFRGDLPREGIF